MIWSQIRTFVFQLQATDNLQVGLTKLAELNKVAWTKGHGCTALSDIMHPPLFSTMSAEWQGGGRDCVDVVVGSDSNNHVLDEGADECCDEVHTPHCFCKCCGILSSQTATGVPLLLMCSVA